MTDNSIDDRIDSFMQEETPSSIAVKSLIRVEKRQKGDTDTDIELKTDLTDDLVRLHSLAQIMSNVLSTDEKTFADNNIIGELVNKLERKLVSKNRMSRTEIVNVARQPDMNMTSDGMQMRDSFMKRLVTPRR